MAEPSSIDLATEICGIGLDGPVLNGSGTFDALAARKVFGDALIEDFPFDCYVSKTITMNPRPGNPPYRLWETPSGMINSIGLPGPGLEGFLARDLDGLAEFGVPLIVSVMADQVEDFEVLVARVAARDEVAGIELNVSCPNVHSGLIVGEQPSETEALMKALRPITEKPLVVKLTPNVANPHEVAVAAEAGGADAVSMINTVKAAAIDPTVNRAWLGAGAGGLSGPAVRPIALAQVRAVAEAVTIPVIGMGGITDSESALEFILAGARVVAVGTENFRDPRAGNAVKDGLPAALRRRGFASLAEAQSATLG
ncbi:MAG: dihydroorotate dehydrogenase [Solirubrobacterales bacterium]|nr:dihydroorotate dehydrogenase [Solirubrobacterales bacterium]MCB8915352.1 dihydroorotate dehydrogenase [Thermoleophilales bacterium]